MATPPSENGIRTVRIVLQNEGDVVQDDPMALA